MAVQVWIVFCNIILDLFSQVTNDKNEISYSCFTQLIYGNAKYRFPG